MKATAYQSVKRMQRAENIFKPVGVVLALALAAWIYWKGYSIWLALFAFVIVSRFVIGCVPKIIFHERRVYRTLFYLLWPVGGTTILYLVYQLWGLMWLAAILGIVGGMLFSVFVGVLFFRDVAIEEQQREEKVADAVIEEQLARNPDAAAMKRRFSGSEWDEIKKIPKMIFATVLLTGDKGKAVVKKGMKKWADAAVSPEQYEDALLRMMLIDELAGLIRSMGQMESLSQLSSVLVEGMMERQFETLASSGRLQADLGQVLDLSPRRAMDTVKANLSADEFRSFIRGLVRLGLDIAFAAGSPNADQIERLLGFVPAESKADLFAMLGVEEDAT